MPGRGGARAALREAGEEAGEKLARQGVKQAAKELPPVVIGENMERVKRYAAKYGYQTIEGFIPPSAWTLERNKQWILQMKHEGRRVIDIGPDFPRRLKRYLAIRRGEPNIPHPVSTPYSLERRLLKGYQHYEKRFRREGKWWGEELP